MTINRLLALDAATCALMGLLLAAMAPGLSILLNLPEGLLWWAGILLLPIAFFMAALARQRTPFAAGVWLVVAGNAAWVVASLAILALTNPNASGVAFVLAQALVVACLALLEAAAVSRHARTA